MCSTARRSRGASARASSRRRCSARGPGAHPPDRLNVALIHAYYRLDPQQAAQAGDQAVDATPAVRKSWLEGGPGANSAARGAEPFVRVSWDRALDLVAAELERVRKEYGNEAIYGSSGWGSAGVFHNARSQLTRFLNLHGGFIDQVTSFSVGAASVIVPRIVGSMQPVFGPVNTWPLDRRVYRADGGVRRYAAQERHGQSGRRRRA